ncbi:hypothetical protein D3C73_957410 [compost metagenome]
MAWMGKKELDDRLQPKGQPGFFSAADSVIASRVSTAEHNSFCGQLRRKLQGPEREGQLGGGIGTEELFKFSGVLQCIRVKLLHGHKSVGRSVDYSF